MEKLKKIGIDLDSTLNNLEVVWAKKYNQDYNDNIVEWPKWEFHEFVKPECGEKIYEYLHEPKFFYNLDIKKDAKKVVEFLSKHYELYIVTAYTPDTCQDKADWVKMQGLNIPQKNIIFINNKGILDLDYLIDDGPHNFDNFKGIGLVFDMLYNRHIEDSNYRTRVKTWEDILEFFIEEINHDKQVDKYIEEYIEEATRKGDNANHFVKKYCKIYSKS